MLSFLPRPFQKINFLIWPSPNNLCLNFLCLCVYGQNVLNNIRLQFDMVQLAFSVFTRHVSLCFVPTRLLTGKTLSYSIIHT